MVREPFRHPLDVPGVRRIAAEAGNTQHIEQLRFERFTIGARIGARGVTGWRHARSSLIFQVNDSMSALEQKECKHFHPRAIHDASDSMAIKDYRKRLYGM